MDISPIILSKCQIQLRKIPAIHLQLCVEDLNSDGIISVQDILILLSDFGCNSMCEYDINQDGAVSIVDLLMMLQAFGGLCEIP